MCQDDVEGCAYCDAVRGIKAGGETVTYSVVPVVYEGEHVAFLVPFMFEPEDVADAKAMDQAYLAVAMAKRAYENFEEMHGE